MASLPLTLAALATSAVPGMNAVAVRRHNSASGDYATAILTTLDDEIILTVPRNPQAETALSAGVLGLTALTEGARASLPFAVPQVLGITRAGETRAIATTFLPGMRFTASELEDDAILIDSLAQTIAAIHALPRSIAQQGGLPERSARDVRVLVARLVDRAEETRLLPDLVHARWTEVLESAEVWDFEPRMVHGSINDDALLVENDVVTGVLDWSELGIGDPASDLFWLYAAGENVFEEVVSRYLELAGGGDASALRSRAQLYHELEIARWLLHGVESHDKETVEDAVEMLDRLVDRIGESSGESHEALGEAEALALLEETPEVADRLSDTAALEALDEDRQFGFDTDFVERIDETAEANGNAETAGTVEAAAESTEAAVAADGSETSEPTESPAAENVTAENDNAAAAVTRDTEPGTAVSPDEQLTAPIDDIKR